MAARKCRTKRGGVLQAASHHNPTGGLCYLKLVSKLTRNFAA